MPAASRGYGASTDTRARTIRPNQRTSRSPSPNTRISSECVPRPIPILPEVVDFQPNKKKAPPSFHQQIRVVDDGSATPRHVRLTHYAMPYSYKVMTNTGLMKSFGAVFQPLAEYPADEGEVPLIDHSQGEGIIRCSGCRGYLNSFCQWLQNGYEWRCPICRAMNKTPAWYYCATDSRMQRQDRLERSELCRGVVDYVAPAAYLREDRKNCNFLFIVDVSTLSISNGMAESVFLYLAHYLQTTYLDAPEARDSDVHFGLLTYSTKVEFHDIYKRKIYIMADVEDPFAVLPAKVVMIPVAQPAESAEEDPLAMFVDYLNTIYDNYANSRTGVDDGCCFGSAVKLGHEVLSEMGGKAVLFQADAPSIGVGKIDSTVDMGSQNACTEMSAWYGEFATKIAHDGVSFDLFCNASRNLHLPTVHSLVNSTGGNIFFYKNYNDESDREALERDLELVLTRYQAVDCQAVVRVPDGVDVNTVITNGLVDNDKNIILSHIHEKSTISITLMVNSDQQGKKLCVLQLAILYTPMNGDSLIRVITAAIPISRASTEIFRTSHLDTVGCMISRVAMADVINPVTPTDIKSGRLSVSEQCTECLYRYRKHCAPRSSSGQLILPEQLKTLPLFSLGVMKSLVFTKELPLDERIHLINKFLYTTLPELSFNFYPRLHRLDTLEDNMLVWMDDGSFVKPPIIPLSRKELASEGLYILCNGSAIFLCIGEDCADEILEGLLEHRDSGIVALMEEPAEDPESLLGRIQALVDDWRYSSSSFLPVIVLSRPSSNTQRTAGDLVFLANFIEDAARRHSSREQRKTDQFHMSYIDYLVFCHGAIRQKQAANH